MIYHITTLAEWADAQAAGVYKPESLLREGFIHCSPAELLLHVANFYFSGRKGLVVLEIDEERLAAEVKWEGEGHAKFPHIYGPLELSSVENVAALKANEAGEFEFPFKPTIH